MADLIDTIGAGIQGLAAIGGSVARKRHMKKAKQTIEKASKEQQASIDKDMAREKEVENQDGMRLASTRRMMQAMDQRIRDRRKQARAMAGMGLMNEGTAEQISEGNETAQLAQGALVEQQQRSDKARMAQEELNAQKRAVIGSEADKVAALHQANAQAAAQAASAIGSQAANVASVFKK